ncbi:hypothetical protein YB2330_003150 [Saitoella coloradoensis]
MAMQPQMAYGGQHMDPNQYNGPMPSESQWRLREQAAANSYQNNANAAGPRFAGGNPQLTFNSAQRPSLPPIEPIHHNPNLPYDLSRRGSITDPSLHLSSATPGNETPVPFQGGGQQPGYGFVPRPSQDEVVGAPPYGANGSPGHAMQPDYGSYPLDSRRDSRDSQVVVDNGMSEYEIGHRPGSVSESYGGHPGSMRGKAPSVSSYVSSRRESQASTYGFDSRMSQLQIDPNNGRSMSPNSQKRPWSSTSGTGPGRPVPHIAPPIFHPDANNRYQPNRTYPFPHPNAPNPTPGFPYAFPDPQYDTASIASTSTGQLVQPSVERVKETPYSRSPELRVSHKMAERKRRREMKDLFDDLRDNLPVDKTLKTSKWEILSKAIEYISNLRVQQESQQREIESLRREVRDLRGGNMN